MALTKVSGGIIQQPIDVGIITATSGDFSGIVTASAFSASTISVTNLTVSGIATYEDVKNIDSIGIITARDTIDAQGNVTVGAGLSVVGISTFDSAVDINSTLEVSGISTISNTVVGGATTELVVTGASYITNDLDVGGIVSSEESAIVMNPNAISRNTTVPANYNARTMGPNITINDGVSVTISSNGEWTITK